MASKHLRYQLTNFLQHLVSEGQAKFDLKDEITRETMVARGGEVTSTRLREILKLPPLQEPAESESEKSADLPPISLEDGDTNSDAS